VRWEWVSDKADLAAEVDNGCLEVAGCRVDVAFYRHSPDAEAAHARASLELNALDAR